MINFSNLSDAIFYRTSCPICKEDLRFKNVSDYSFSGTTISLSILTSIGDNITISTRGNIIEKISISRDNCLIETDSFYKDSAFASTDYSIFDNTLASPITVSCYKCEQFSYHLQVYANLASMKITDIFLERESVSIEDGSLVHEISNFYTAKQTRYSVVYSDGSSKSIEIPLLPLNLDKPTETVERIKKLLIFS